MRKAVSFGFVVCSLALVSCDALEDSTRRQEVRNLLQSALDGQDRRMEELTCSEISDDISPEEIIEMIRVMHDLDLEELTLRKKEERLGDLIYVYDLGDLTVEVGFCPPGSSGTIAHLRVFK